MAGASSLLRPAFKAACAACDPPGRHRAGAVVLIYHRVGARTRVDVDLPAALFDQQMAELSGRVVPLDGVVAGLESGVVQGRPVAITFDDGTADWVDLALPILVHHGVPVTFYVATGFVDRQRPFPDGGRPVSWAGLREALSTGLVTIGSHTHGHLLLDRCGSDVVADELDRSRGLIEDRLGVAADHFAYPKAVPATGAAEDEVRRRFRSAAVGGCRPNRPGRTDLHRLTRSAVQASDGMRWFRHKAAGGMFVEDALRRARNRRRYAGATT